MEKYQYDVASDLWFLMAHTHTFSLLYLCPCVYLYLIANVHVQRRDKDNDISISPLWTVPIYSIGKWHVKLNMNQPSSRLEWQLFVWLWAEESQRHGVLHRNFCRLMQDREWKPWASCQVQWRRESDRSRADLQRPSHPDPTSPAELPTHASHPQSMDMENPCYEVQGNMTLCPIKHI